MTVRARQAWTALFVLCAVALMSACSEGSGSSDEPTPAEEGPLSLVVLGDSIPFNSPMDCSACTGFVDQYADALQEATGREVRTMNLSEHTGLTLEGLMAKLPSYEDPVSHADAVIVAIAHNSVVLNEDKPCGSPHDPTTGAIEDWSRVTRACAEAGTARHRPMFDELYSTIASWRADQPTILLTLDKYNDWIGYDDAHLTPADDRRTVMVHRLWNKMMCDTAEAHDFTCIDVNAAFNGPAGAKAAGDLLGDDYTHPSQKGNDLIARLLVQQGFAPLA